MILGMPSSWAKQHSLKQFPGTRIKNQCLCLYQQVAQLSRSGYVNRNSCDGNSTATLCVGGWGQVCCIRLSLVWSHGWDCPLVMGAHWSCSQSLPTQLHLQGSQLRVFKTTPQCKTKQRHGDDQEIHFSSKCLSQLQSFSDYCQKAVWKKSFWFGS